MFDHDEVIVKIPEYLNQDEYLDLTVYDNHLLIVREDKEKLKINLERENIKADIILEFPKTYGFCNVKLKLHVLGKIAVRGLITNELLVTSALLHQEQYFYIIESTINTITGKISKTYIRNCHIASIESYHTYILFLYKCQISTMESSVIYNTLILDSTKIIVSCGNLIDNMSISVSSDVINDQMRTTDLRLLKLSNRMILEYKQNEKRSWGLDTLLFEGKLLDFFINEVI